MASNIGTWMQNIGATWLMTTLNPSPFWVSMVQAANYLPVFLLSLPAGAMADLLDRRKLLIFTQFWMLFAAGFLGVTTQLHVTTVAILLSMTFLMGVGNALNSPAWQAILPETVAPEELGPAIALGSASVNLARAVGPALGGVVLAIFGPAVNFYLNALSFLAVIFVLQRWERKPVEQPGPPEKLVGAIISGLRYTLHAPDLHRILLRCIVFVLPASALWALLPVVTHDLLHQGASTYGVLLGCLGIGAVLGTFVLDWARRNFSFDTQASITALFFAVATLSSAWVTEVPVLGFTLILGGVAWLSTLTTFIALVQCVVPGWVRARALAAYLLLFFGAMAAGSACWGALASSFGTRASLSVSGACLIAGIAFIRWMPLEHLMKIGFLNSSASPVEPEIAHEIDLHHGPIR